MKAPAKSWTLTRTVGAGLLAIVAGSLVVVGGVSAYHWSRFRGCEDAVLAAREKGSTSVEAGITWGTLAFETFNSSESAELRRSATRWHQKVDEIVAKGRRWPTSRVYLVGDMVYFVFFGGDDRIRDFVCVGN
jgi:hypothetical protein